MARAAATAPYRVEERSLTRVAADLARGRVTSVQLVRAYLARIAALDAKGPALQSIIAINPNALADARAADALRRAGKAVGPLAGIPVLIKDNIESDDPTPTTAGSLALARNVTRRDAPVVKRLKAAGAIVLGKTNLSEWANIRSTHSISGWSAVGGLVKNPYSLDRNACGSSSGTGAAIAASFAAAGVGTETDGSVVCPSSLNGLVGLKPTVGLVSRTHVVPISHSQDTPGPMARSVGDVALMLTGMAGSDPADPATRDADAHVTDYFMAAADGTLRGKRIGVLRFATGRLPQVDALFAAALATMRAQGATIVEIRDFKPDPHLGDDELLVLLTELKADLNAYLATTPPSVKTRTLAQLIAFNRADPRELSLFGQELFELAQKTKGLRDPAYLAARRTHSSMRTTSTRSSPRAMVRPGGRTSSPAITRSAAPIRCPRLPATRISPSRWATCADSPSASRSSARPGPKRRSSRSVQPTKRQRATAAPQPTHRASKQRPLSRESSPASAKSSRAP
jgi:amidase